MTNPSASDFVEIKDISTGYPTRLKPKEFLTTMTRCVNRPQQVDDILTMLEAAVVEQSIPGVYIAGPAGVGKSVLAYIITQICKYEKQWLTVYIPDCRAWVDKSDDEVKAKGFFLDHVLDALSTKEMQDEFSEIYQKLKEAPDLGYTPPAGETWTHAGRHYDDTNKQKVAHLYNMVTGALTDSRVNVLFVCDEINALWAVADSCYEREPWNLTRFQPKFLRKGALLLTGTTDNDYVGNIPTGLDKHVYPVGTCSDGEFESMRDLDGYNILKDIEELEAGKWQSIADAAGNIPRELRLFVDEAKRSGVGKRIKHFMENDAEDEPSTKKAKKEAILNDVNRSIERWRANNVRRHQDSLDHVLRGQEAAGNTVFKDRLFDACKSIFLRGRAAPTTNEVLRVPNFVVNAVGMYPTTADAQKVYFGWFCNEERRNTFMNSSVATLFDQFMSASNGGDRGNKFEDYLAAKLTSLGRENDSKFVFRRLTTDPNGATEHALPLRVSERVFTSSDTPPRNFQHFADDTLLTHRDPDGGEARVDLIHYRKDRVIFIEATVGDYRKSKVPTEEDMDGRQNLILKTLQKWLGKDVFSLDISPIAAHGQQLASAPKELSVAYNATSNRDRPDLPKIYYIVATTCPETVLPTPSRINKYNWINVCFLEDLITAKIIPAERKDEIINKQAEGAK